MEKEVKIIHANFDLFLCENVNQIKKRQKLMIKKYKSKK